MAKLAIVVVVVLIGALVATAKLEQVDEQKLDIIRMADESRRNDLKKRLNRIMQYTSIGRRWSK